MNHALEVGIIFSEDPPASYATKYQLSVAYDRVRSTFEVRNNINAVCCVCIVDSHNSCLGSRLERLRGTRAIPHPTVREFPA